MRILVEVFRNSPPGKSCRTLSQNALDVVASNLDKDIEVKFLPLDSPEAEERGVEIAPALVINGKTLVEGIPSPEEIAKLIEGSLPVNLGIILTKAPHEGEYAENALDIALEALHSGDQAGLFLLSDAVWVARKGQQGEVGHKLGEFLGQGGEVLVSGEHLEAAGLGGEKLVPGASIASQPFDELVDLVMERWDRVIVL